jgi:ribosomal protein S24E
MNLKIIKQQKNPFLEREELTLKIENEVTPSFDELKQKLGKDTNLTIIKKINTNFGEQTFIAEAVIYDNKEAKEKIETIPQKIRKKLETEEKTAKEAEKKTETEEPAPEKPKEETKPTETPAE